MKILNCPINGPRNINEFQCFGPVKDEAPETAESIVSRIFHAANPAGPLVEWWRHTPSNTFFLAERNTLTDEIIRTWLPAGTAGEPEQ
ncbi:sarcosine oxidase subunit delta [Rhizobiaceae bacterium BDR2-2]|uniref:Sarcosine oxidase subunit delta n=1 Tax=Ectorhizobium quercum TaxID=2965071 RepID=A0AAE3MVG6_9HYPH|nr:sarcosine oxidase subunit delta [Ectorhizobium quercum]MCX8995928.1 sarcosine oxidase subunit delta [Ectorhizobium quercum]